MELNPPQTPLREGLLSNPHLQVHLEPLPQSQARLWGAQELGAASLALLRPVWSKEAEQGHKTPSPGAESGTEPAAAGTGDRAHTWPRGRAGSGNEVPAPAWPWQSHWKHQGGKNKNIFTYLVCLACGSVARQFVSTLPLAPLSPLSPFSTVLLWFVFWDKLWKVPVSPGGPWEAPAPWLVTGGFTSLPPCWHRGVLGHPGGQRDLCQVQSSGGCSLCCSLC